MTTSGPGTYFDGVTSTRLDVTIELAPAALRILAADGTVLAEWPYGEIEHLSAPDHVLRLGRTGHATLARLEVRDPQLAHAIDELAHTVDRSGHSERRSRLKIAAWSCAAAVSLFLVGVLLVPEIATRLAPLVPYGVERRLGDAVDVQVRRMLDTRRAGEAFECGAGAGEQPGRTVFDRLIGEFERAAALPFPLRVTIVRRPDANAIALPGGRVYVFQGLIDKSETPDELAGVIAHEVGHVAHRDGTRHVLQAAGVSLLFGFLLGDFVGGGAVVIAARAVLQSSYSREAEAAADAYAVKLMNKIGGDGRGLATILSRIAGGTHSFPKILLDHPETQRRVAAINALAAGTDPPKAILGAADWAALKRICAKP